MANTSIKPICNALSLPITYLPSLSTALTPKSLLRINPILSIRTRSVKLQSSLHPSLILVPKKRTSFPSHVAQTSDWAQQEEQGDGSSPSALQDLEEDSVWDDAQFDPPQPILSDSEDSGGGVAAGDVDLQGAEEVPGFSEEAKLFVGNLPYDVDSERLAQLFEPAGVVEIAEVIYNRETDQSRGFGFVTMRTVEEAEKVVEMFNRYDINGRFLTVNKAAPRGTRPELPLRTIEPSSRIYVGNLPWDVDNSRLEEVFSQYGNVISARVVFDRETGRSRGFGFVTMSSDKEMNDAIAALDGQAVDGRTVRVNVAQERPRRNF